MRHQRVQKKFGRDTAHREELMKSLVANLIINGSIVTTLPKSKQARKDAEKLVTIARKGTLAARRLCASRLVQPKNCVGKLFSEVVPKLEGRNGGYTRILKIGNRRGDGTPMAVLQWVYVAQPVEASGEEAPAPEAEAKPEAK